MMPEPTWLWLGQLKRRQKVRLASSRTDYAEEKNLSRTHNLAVKLSKLKYIVCAGNGQ